MNISRVSMRGFMSHANTVFTFPPKGLVLITGANGSGKSSIVEAVSVGGWGKTLRGTEPWSGDSSALDLATLEGVDVSRKVEKKSKTLLWSEGGKTATKYETNTKAQDALETVLGSHDIWRRASVFSSQDASHFTLASDAERKRLLESILGLERFDVAADKARAAAAIASATTTRLEREAAIAAERLKAAEAAVAQAASALEAHGEVAAGMESVAALSAKAEKLDTEIKTAASESKKLAKSIEGATSDLATAERDVQRARQASTAANSAASLAGERARRARADLARLTGQAGAQCPTCEQPMGNAKRDRLTREADDAEQTALAAKKEADAANAKADAEAEAAAAQVEELREERDMLRQRAAPLTERVKKLHEDLARVEQDLRAAKASEAVRTRLQAAAESAGEALAAARTKAGETEAAAAKADKERRTYEACAKVLGTKGVRAHVLGSALGGMEVIANQWLARLGTRIALTISSYTEKKTGGVSDAIGLNFIFGDGRESGYRAASGGERRRVDVALLLALGEISAAAHGKEPGTLFIDEVFDTLDVEGVAAIVGVLRELAASRCVVVITHNPELVTAMRADKHYIVDAGTVAEA